MTWRVAFGTGHKTYTPDEWAWIQGALPDCLARLRFEFGTEIGVTSMARGFELEFFESVERADGLVAHGCIPHSDMAKRWLAGPKTRWQQLVDAAGGVGGDRIHCVGDLTTVPRPYRSTASNNLIRDAHDEALSSADVAVICYDPMRQSGMTHRTYLKARGVDPVRGRTVRLPFLWLNPAERRVRLAVSHLPPLEEDALRRRLRGQREDVRVCHR